MITVKLPLQFVFHSFLCGFISHSHRFDLLIKSRIQFLFRYTTKCLIMLVHTDVVRLVKTTEHTHLWELSNTSQQNKLQVGIGFLKNGIKTFEKITVILFQTYFILSFSYRNIHIHDIQQWLIVFINQYDSPHSCLLMSFPQHCLKAAA